MKKYLLIGALAVAGMAFANRSVANLPQVTKMTANQKIETVKDAYTSTVANISERKAIRAQQAASYAAVDYYYTEGAFHNGLFSGFTGFGFAGMVLPYEDSVVYTNYYGPTNWYEDGELKLENSKTFTTHYGIIPDGYVGSVPQTSDHELTIGTNTYLIKGTSYGNTASKVYVFSALPEHPSMLGGDNIPMTLCAMHCDTLEDTHDYWRIGGGSTADPYFNGTGIHLDSADRAITADTLGVLVDNKAVMKFDQIIFTIYADNVYDTATVIPDGAELKLEIFPLTETGIDFENPIATTTLTQADLNIEPQSWGMLGTLDAKFYETDIFGTVTQVPLWIEGGFFLQLTNFNETNCNFGIFADYNCPVTATTVYKYKGEWRYRGKKNGGGKYGQNLLISFDGYFPTLSNFYGESELTAPVAGGLATYEYDGYEMDTVAILTNIEYASWEVENDSEDWLTVAFDDVDFADYNAVYVTFEAAELPEGTAYREALVTLNADGAVLEFVVKQGTNPEEAIDNVNFKNDGKSYNVLGIEVNDDYKGVIIRNGEKFIR